MYRKSIVWISAAVLALVLFGNGGFQNLVSNWRERRRAARFLEKLRADHDSLSRELARLQQDPSYTEYLIRKNLGYVKKGEYEYRLLKSDKANP